MSQQSRKRSFKTWVERRGMPMLEWESADYGVLSANVYTRIVIQRFSDRLCFSVCWRHTNSKLSTDLEHIYTHTHSIELCRTHSVLCISVEFYYSISPYIYLCRMDSIRMISLEKLCVELLVTRKSLHIYMMDLRYIRTRHCANNSE